MSDNNMVIKKVKAFCRRDVSTLVDVMTSLTYSDVKPEKYESYVKSVEEKEKIVIVPVEYSLEHYKEKSIQIASFCQMHTIKIVEENNEKNLKKVTIGYKCINRCKILKVDIVDDVILVDVELLDRQQFDENLLKLKYTIFDRFKTYLKYDYVSVFDVEYVKTATDVDQFIKEIVLACDYDVGAKRKLLGELDAEKRLKVLLDELETKIFEKISDKGKDIFTYYKNKINELELESGVKRQIYDELVRLKTIKETQSEYGNIIDWLDRVLKLPWNTFKEENNDIEYAKKMLDETHYGMNKLKQKILDYIVLRIVSGKNPSHLLCLYGPPGVGKSTIVKSIAKALNKDYFSFSLGGVSHPEEINGMKRYYIGAKPGRIMEGISHAGSKNCIILLDEIDKMTVYGNRGDPYSVLLDILDRNQNAEFKDRYFDIPFDISNVMFIATANSLKTIPEPVLNRLEIITIDGYSLNEKLHIAKQYILPKTLKEIGVSDGLISFDDKTLQTLIEDYTFESGVRQLERMITEIAKKYIVSKYLDSKDLENTVISLEQAREYLGDDFYEEEYNVAVEGEVGVVNKMAVRGPSGAITRLEIALVKGDGEQILSDNIVGTAKWTFKTVFGLLKSKADTWGIDTKVFEENNFYIHSPHHSISNDGPSGGVADVICLISAIKEQPVNHKVAFTGEISLKGKVLAIGGMKEKLLAAQRNKIETVVIPLQNKKDVEKLSDEIVGSMNIKYIDNIDEAYDFVFVQNCKIESTKNKTTKTKNKTKI